MIVGWLALTGVTGPLFGNLSSVQKNDNADFLPANVEAQKFADEYKAFSVNANRELPALVLFVGDVTPEKIASANTFLATLASKPLVDIDGKKIAGVEKTIGDYLTSGQQLFTFPSQDGKALLANVPFDNAKATAQLADKKPALPAVVNAIRFYSDEFAKSAGLETHVTGFAAIFADLFSAFGAIDSTLLLTTLSVVALILIVVYRSPVLWILPLFTALVAEALAGAVIYILAKQDLITLDGQSQGILSVLVIGGATDYALLLIARYREELHHFDSRFDAMKVAWRGVVEPIIASGSTVTLGLLVLLLSQLSNTRGLGPVGAIGIVASMITVLTLLPALLVVFGRWIFWPRVPRHDDKDEKLTGLWSKVAHATANSPKKFAIVTTVILLVFAGFITTLKASGISTTEGFTSRPDSLIGQDVLLEHFPGGQSQPTQILITESKVSEAVAALKSIDGVSSVVPEVDGQVLPGQPMPAIKVINGKVVLDATLNVPADSKEGRNLVPIIRDAVHPIDSQSLVGGISATFYDLNVVAAHDRNLIIPIVLILIAIILGLLLRSIVAAVVLLVTVILSFVATLGVSALVFNHIFGFAGADTGFPLFTFIFLVALGIDYNIFLMTRVREEAIKIGTIAGVTKGVTVTGGVITSAGVVLAATFTVLGVLPLVALAQIGFAVAFGVLLDTLVVRSILVPALVHLLGPKIWWPAKNIK
ncbi:MAG: MMPL family transporter [Actinobacteria bacterium]|nr:MMPL family transporter [Actinomycetota bacterium]